MFWEKKRIYADAAAATPISPAAMRELERLLPLYGNPGALHREALDAKEELEKARGTIAESIGAHADEIVFTASGTEANNLAIQGVLRPLLLERGEVHAITCAVEHQSVLVPLQALEREGLYLTVLPVDSEGLVDPKALAEAINEQTAFVSVQLVNSEVGTVEPVRELAKVLRKQKNKIYFHTDACQAPLWVPIAVEKLGVDLMTLDGQKVLGPKGVGALYIKRGVEVEPILWGGSQERGLRGGTQNAPLAGSFAVALAEAARDVAERAEATAAVRDFLWSEIKRLVPSAMLNGPALAAGSAMGRRRRRSGPLGQVLPSAPAPSLSPALARVANNLSVSIPGLSGELAVVSLDAEGIAASTRSACNTGDEEPSHVIKALGVPKEMAKTAIRITLLPEATKTDATRIAQALADIAARQLRQV